MDDTLLKQARDLHRRNGGPSCPIPPVILMTDDQRLPDPDAAIRTLPRDSMVIFRHYDHPSRARLGSRLRTLCRGRGLPFLVANDVSLALKLGADGVHLPEYRIWHDAGIYQQIPKPLLRTSACHTPVTVRRLARLPADIRPDGVLISPVFPTQSHPGASALPLADVLAMARVCQRGGMVPIGLGGVTEKTIGNLQTSALASVAGIGFSETNICLAKH